MWRMTILRRLSQFAFLLVFFLIPLTNLFRVDLVHGVVWIWNTPYVIGAMNAAGVPIVMTAIFSFFFAFMFFLFAVNLIADRLFCGFYCPQNTFTELLDSLSLYLTGRRSRWDPRNVSGLGKRLHGEGASRRLRQGLGWTLAVLGLLLVSFLSATYLVPVQDLWSGWFQVFTIPFWAFWGSFLFWAVFVALVRHQWCRVCPFGNFYQRMFDFMSELIENSLPFLGDGLRVQMIRERVPTCIHCNLCEKACWFHVPILSDNHHPDCISCGACVDACAYALRKKGLPAIPDFAPAGSPSLNTSRTGAKLFHIGRRHVLAGATLFLVLGLMWAPNLSNVTLVPTALARRPVVVHGLPHFEWKVYLRNNTFDAMPLRFVAVGKNVETEVKPARLQIAAGGTAEVTIEADGTRSLTHYRSSFVTLTAKDPQGRVVMSHKVYMNVGGL